MKVKDLGAVVGTEEFRKEYVIMRVNEWVTELKLPTKISKFYQQAANFAFTSYFRQKFTHTIRTIPNTSQLLQPIENVIQQEFITSLLEERTWIKSKIKTWWIKSKVKKAEAVLTLETAATNK